MFHPDGKPYLAWWDTTGGDWEIYLKTWNGSDWVEAGEGSAAGGGVSDNYGFSESPSLGVDGEGILYLAWFDHTSGNHEIYVKRYTE
jgi:hypothetical protein